MPTTYTNLFQNPRPVTGGPVGWSSVTGAGGVVDGTYETGAGGPAGDYMRRVTFNTAPTNVAGGTTIGTAALPIPASASTVYSLAIYVRPSRTQRIIVRVTWMDGSYVSLGTSVDSAGTVCSANTWTEIKLENVTSIASTANIRMQCLASSGTGGVLWQAGDTIDFQAATVVQAASVPEPFHGSIPDAGDNTYSWTGTDDASTSTLVVADPVGPQVPTWVGAGATAVSSTQVDLDWNPSANSSKYDLDRALAPGGTPGTYSLLVTDLATTAYSDTTCAPATTYAYRVRGVE
jgi:hypothetical protein